MCDLCVGPLCDRCFCSQFLLSRITGYLRRRTIIFTDRRVQLMNEILAAIKLIKQYAWEATFVKRITGQSAA